MMKHTLRTTVFAALSLSALTGLIIPAAHSQTKDLYLLNSGYDTITRYASSGPGTFSTAPFTTNLAATNPEGLAFDTSGNLFVTEFVNGGGNIVEFPAGANADTFGAPKRFTDPSLNGPSGLTFDARGDLFAANRGTSFNGVGTTITEFAAGTVPGTLGAATVLSGGGLNGPAGLAFDARGDLFAANSNANTITEFAAGTVPGTLGAGTVIASGLNHPAGLAFDPIGNLFVVNEGTFGASSSSNILKFAFNSATGTFGPAQTVETGTSGVQYLAFGPPGVPEASTVVSFGLLLALSAGGLVIAARRKRTDGKGTDGKASAAP